MVWLVKIMTRRGTAGKAKANFTITKRRRRRGGGEDIRGKRVTGALCVHIISGIWYQAKKAPILILPPNS